MWGGAEFTPSLSGGMKAPKAVGLALVEKSGVQEPSGHSTCDAYCYTLQGGGPPGTAPSEPDNHGHCSAPRKPLCLVWCDSLLSLVLFR
jgi:hypothetical protein